VSTVHILILTQYYKPESVGPTVWLRELTADLLAAGHRVTVLTSFPNHPMGVIFPEYRGRIFQREVMDGIEVLRTWIYATPSKAFWPRVANFGSFVGSSLIAGLLAARPPDMIYAILPPLPLGITALTLGVAKRSRVVVNIQDIHPQIAVALGVLRNPLAIRFFEAMERWIYRYSDGIVVISEGFRDNLLGKDVPSEKIHIVPNWADPDFIRPGPLDNEVRREWRVGENFTLVYSGGLTHNSNLEPLIEAASMLQGEPFRFVIIGEGVKKPFLESTVRDRNLGNVQTFPFQPLERYPLVLTAADMSLVTLGTRASLASVPSKIFKMLASGRPILAIASQGTEIYHLIQAAQCGFCVEPDNADELVGTLRYAAAHREEIEAMGRHGRLYLEQKLARQICTGRIERVLREVSGL
jgi:colanic acid biosynthesis glycosyl transferase WcaI